jgi:hypothetical protein
MLLANIAPGSFIRPFLSDIALGDLYALQPHGQSSPSKVYTAPRLYWLNYLVAYALSHLINELFIMCRISTVYVVFLFRKEFHVNFMKFLMRSFLKHERERLMYEADIQLTHRHIIGLSNDWRVRCWIPGTIRHWLKCICPVKV